MGVYESRAQLASAFHDLTERWLQVKGEWHDANAEAFEKTFLLPLEAELRHASAAMDQMEGFLRRLRQECE